MFGEQISKHLSSIIMPNFFLYLKVYTYKDPGNFLSAQ